MQHSFTPYYLINANAHSLAFTKLSNNNHWSIKSSFLRVTYHLRFISSLKKYKYLLHVNIFSNFTIQRQKHNHKITIKRVVNLKPLQTQQSFRKYLNTGSLISVFKSFLLVLTKFPFWRGDWALGYQSLDAFLIFPNFVIS